MSENESGFVGSVFPQGFFVRKVLDGVFHYTDFKPSPFSLGKHSSFICPLGGCVNCITPFQTLSSGEEE